MDFVHARLKEKFFFTLDGKIVHIINTLVMRLALICGICGTF